MWPVSERSNGGAGSVGGVRQLVAGMTGPDPAVLDAARARLAGRTKPRDSLGLLEDVAVRYAAVRGAVRCGPVSACVVIAAADHGVSAYGVSAYPAEVTGQMISTVLRGGAASAVLAASVGARLAVVDCGTAAARVAEGVLDRRPASGPGGDLVLTDALRPGAAEELLDSGVRWAADRAAEGITLIGLGELGIANTTPAAALTSALLGLDAAAVCGPGTGLDAAGLRRKVDAVRAATARVGARDVLGTLTGLGGAEIAFLAGVVLGAAAARVPVLVDGVVTGAAALVAARLAPAAPGSLLAAHLSPEPAHAQQLAALGLTPMLQLNMRLGEGTGALLAVPLVRAAVAVLTEMAGFADAGVTDTGA
ncbi:MAG TPA: nicotinate-nucleotide--dimethylbenzimidazole phosphoribosyltransferase [Mycobacteriales bacterium]